MTKPALSLIKCAVLVQLTIALGGCSSQNLSESLTQTASLGEPSRVTGSPLVVYGLIASGAMNCWFAPAGQLKKTHIFHAVAESPVKGGAAEIAVHERDVAGGQTWGARVFKIVLKPAGEQTDIEVGSLKLPAPIANLMRDDVFDWAQGGKGCRLKPAEAEPVIPAPLAARKSVKAKTPKAP